MHLSKEEVKRKLYEVIRSYTELHGVIRSYAGGRCVRGDEGEKDEETLRDVPPKPCTLSFLWLQCHWGSRPLDDSPVEGERKKGERGRGRGEVRRGEERKRKGREMEGKRETEERSTSMREKDMQMERQRDGRKDRKRERKRESVIETDRGMYSHRHRIRAVRGHTKGTLINGLQRLTVESTRAVPPTTDPLVPFPL